MYKIIQNFLFLKEGKSISYKANTMFKKEEIENVLKYPEYKKFLIEIKVEEKEEEVAFVEPKKEEVEEEVEKPIIEEPVKEEILNKIKNKRKKKND